jgi:hypothetical protein
LPFAGSIIIAAVFRPTDVDLFAGTPVLPPIDDGTTFFAPPFFFVAIASPNLPLLMKSKSSPGSRPGLTFFARAAGF